MKKQILILAIGIIPGLFISCSKQQHDLPLTDHSNNEELATSSASANRNNIDPLTVNLEGWYTFDNTLKDKAGKLPDAQPTSRIYYFGKDRKGNLKGAMSFDSTYGLTIANVPQQTHTSLSAWVKFIYPRTTIAIMAGDGGAGPNLFQSENVYSYSVFVDTYGSVGPQGGFSANNNWHHLVITYDGSVMKFYVDGSLFSSYSYAGTITATKVKYYIAKTWVGEYWRGYVDDLRFYSRTLSSKDVLALYNQ